MYDQRDLLTARSILLGGPGIDVYQGWADRVGEYASAVTADGLGPYTQLVADNARLVVQAVGTVRAPEWGPPTVDAAMQQPPVTFFVAVNQITDAENAMMDMCRRG